MTLRLRQALLINQFASRCVSQVRRPRRLLRMLRAESVSPTSRTSSNAANATVGTRAVILLKAFGRVRDTSREQSILERTNCVLCIGAGARHRTALPQSPFNLCAWRSGLRRGNQERGGGGGPLRDLRCHTHSEACRCSPGSYWQRACGKCLPNLPDRFRWQRSNRATQSMPIRQARNIFCTASNLS